MARLDDAHQGQQRHREKQSDDAVALRQLRGRPYREMESQQVPMVQGRSRCLEAGSFERFVELLVGDPLALAVGECLPSTRDSTSSATRANCASHASESNRQ